MLSDDKPKAATRRGWRLAGLVAALCVTPQTYAAKLDVSAVGPFDATNRIIVKYKTRPALSVNGVTTELSARTGLKLRFKRALSSGAQVFDLPQWRNRAELNSILAALARDPNIEYVEPDVLLQTRFTPNDSRYNEQWHYFENQGGMNLPAAWDNATGQGVVVGVIDTGYLPHDDLAANILPGYDMVSDTFIANDGDGRDGDARDPGDYVNVGECGGGWPPTDLASSWHGTHVAGTVADVTDNGMGVAGVAFGAKVLPVRALGKCGGFVSDIADAIVWASGSPVAGVPTNPTPAQVLNLSVGGAGRCSNTMQNAINAARQSGATVVVAAGNSSADAGNESPANCNGVITVTASDRNGGLAFYSNTGSVVDIAAPGGETLNSIANGILSTLNTGITSPQADTYDFYQGTSMATPHIAGLAALLYEADPAITPDQVENIIENTARPFAFNCRSCGAGIADAAAAVIAAQGGNPGGPPPPSPPPPDNGNPGESGSFSATDLSGRPGSWQYFSFEIPEGMAALEVNLSGSGNPDLYVQFGAPPSRGAFDCRSTVRGANDSCSIANPQAGTWYVGIRGRFFYTGVDLNAVWMP